jgi:bis(5'-nucleosyl)-tetraphosphatase (symmetrical)
MTDSRIIFIGDVHGCYEELKLLLKKTKYKDGKDRLIFLGDLINKGPYSIEVVDFVRSGNHECIMGNHELGFLRSLEDPSYFKKGFKKFYEELGAKREEVITWMRGLPLYIEEEDFLCIHGGIQPGVPLENQKPRVATRIRTWGGDEDDLNDPDNPPWHKLYKGEKTVIYGHWAMQGYHKTKNTICLDSGCVWGGSLTGLIWPERKAVHIPALKQYKKP